MYLPCKSGIKELSPMPDPNAGQYAALWVRFPYLKGAKVAVPNDRDSASNGCVIHPSEYRTSSKSDHHLKPVFVEALAYMRGELPFFQLIPCFMMFDGPISCQWEILPDKHAASNYNENGSRVYQLVIKRMDLLPSNVLAKNVIEYSANTKGKKRVSTYSLRSYNGPSTPRKARHDSVQVSDDSDVNMEDFGEKFS
jgi:hypothetical protein